MDVVGTLQELVGQVPALVRPLIVALAGAIPYVEGEGGAVLGIVSGIHPVVAAVAAAAGNFLVVAGLVLLGSGARQAVVARRRAGSVAVAEAPEDERRAARRAKFTRAYERYGVPGVSLLGPLLLPTHFTATMLAATGVGKARVLVWQAVAIVGWTTLTALLVTGVLGAVR
ncbi:small multidrug efflux protein [Promicromonospora citrea]|nr:small multidrug efflux protein [Promicromonospora citrea]NNH52227.1 small multidrug efflux protein [Promicromonospora citrea]